MPVTVQGSNETSMDFSKQDFNYDYPDGLNLKPGSSMHDKLRTKIIENANASSTYMSQRQDSWKKIDNTLTLYMEPTEAEKALTKENPNIPVNIVFPYSYTILETMLSHLVAAFLQDPIFMYEGVGKEDVTAAKIMQMVISQHCSRNKVGLGFHTVFRDSLAYGLGACAPTWEEHWGSVERMEERRSGFLGRNRTKERVLYENELLFEGNGLDNIDPYLMLPDPNVSIHKYQDGEFFGWLERNNRMNLLNEEKHDDEMFNAKYLKGLGNSGSAVYRADYTNRNKRSPDKSDNSYSTSSQPIDRIKMYINLIPKEWELGDGEYPEKWYFELANDQVLLKAKPLGLYHNLYPVGINAPDFDGYSTSPVSRMELLAGLQKTVDWMFNSHVTNVRKAINDMFIVDPYLVNINDVRDPQPGKIIRLRKPAWGQGVKDAIQQFNVNDVTRQNIADANWITTYMDKTCGTDSAMQGSLRQGGPERLTGAEFKGTQQGMYTRMGRLAMITGQQVMHDVGSLFAYHTKQLMSQDTYIKLTGDSFEQLAKVFGPNARFQVKPEDILCDYDLKVRDGSIPSNDQANTWARLFEVITKNETLSQEFDVFRIFEQMALNAGAKNIDDFRKVESNMQFNSAPDEEVMREAERGNLVPFNAFNTGGI